MDISADFFRVLGVLYWIFLIGIPLFVIFLVYYIVKTNRKKNEKLDQILDALNSEEKKGKQHK